VTRTNFLTLEQVIFIHEEQIEQYGGSHGIGRLSLLESAVIRVQMTFGGKELYHNLFDKAASLLHGLVFNHAFVDGNKRTAIASTMVFLELNGYSFILPQKKLVQTIVEIENKKWDKDKIKAWLKKHSKRIQ